MNQQQPEGLHPNDGGYSPGRKITEQVIPMAYPRCPQMDILGNKLIESYRDMIEADVSAALNHRNRDNRIVEVQREMIEHRNSCMLCKRNSMTRSMKVIAKTA